MIKKLILCALVCLSLITISRYVITLLHLNSKNDQSAQVVANAERLAGNNNNFFKGLYGAVVPGFYISHGENDNVVYCRDKTILRFGKANTTEAFIIITSENEIRQINLNDALEINHDVVLIFTPAKIYVLNYDTGNYSYYLR